MSKSVCDLFNLSKGTLSSKIDGPQSCRNVELFGTAGNTEIERHLNRTQSLEEWIKTNRNS